METNTLSMFGWIGGGKQKKEQTCLGGCDQPCWSGHPLMLVFPLLTLFWFWVIERVPLQFPYLTSNLSFFCSPSYLLPGLPHDSFFFHKYEALPLYVIFLRSIWMFVLFPCGNSLSIVPTLTSFSISMETLQSLPRYDLFTEFVLALTHPSPICDHLFSNGAMSISPSPKFASNYHLALRISIWFILIYWSNPGTQKS